MSWSGGTYTKGNNATGGWTGDASLGIGIEAGRHDTQDDDFATGINTCLTKDGSNSPSANLPMGGYKHTGVANASAGDEYLSYAQLLDVSKAVTTAGTAPAYTVSLTPTPAAYFDGMSFDIECHADTTGAAATLNVNGLGAKPLYVKRVSTLNRDLHEFELSQGGAYRVTYEAGSDAFFVHAPTLGGLDTFLTTIGSTGGTATIGSQSNIYTYIAPNVIQAAISVTFGLASATSANITLTLPKAASTVFNFRPINVYVFAVSGYASYAATGWLSGSTVTITRTDQIDFPIDPSMTIRLIAIYGEA